MQFATGQNRKKPNDDVATPRLATPASGLRGCFRGALRAAATLIVQIS